MSLRLVALSGLFLAALPVMAQQDYDYSPPPADQAPQAEDDGLGLIERGMGMILQNLMEDVGPDLNNLGDSMSGALSRMAPVLKDLSVLVDDLGNYQTPERLENGDIIIRREADAPPPPPIGDSLKEFGTPEDQDKTPVVPRDPYAPEIEL